MSRYCKIKGWKTSNEVCIPTSWCNNKEPLYTQNLFKSDVFAVKNNQLSQFHKSIKYSWLIKTVTKWRNKYVYADGKNKTISYSSFICKPIHCYSRIQKYIKLTYINSTYIELEVLFLPNTSGSTKNSCWGNATWNFRKLVGRG